MNEAQKNPTRAEAQAAGILCRHCRGYTDNETGCTCVKQYIALKEREQAEAAIAKHLCPYEGDCQQCDMAHEGPGIDCLEAVKSIQCNLGKCSTQ